MIGLHGLSIRSKLVALAMLASAAALLLACTGFLAYDLFTFRESFSRRMMTQAEIVGSNSAAALVFGDEEAAGATLESLRAEPSVTGAALYRASGSLIASYRRGDVSGAWIRESLSPRALSGLHYGDGVLTTSLPVMLDGERVGTVVIRGELLEIERRATRYLGIASLVLVVSLLVGYGISVFPRRAILRPILELANTAELVSHDRDYTVRARKHGDDELGFLVDTFNQMLDDIERRNRDLAEARDKALEAVRLKSSFLANMSHEIRTPLNVILGYNNVIADDLEERGDESQKANLAAVQRASRRLIETIDGILDISKIESRTFDLRPLPLEVAPLIERQIEELRPLADQKKLDLRAEIEVPGAVVVFDEYCLTHALMNLLQNAIKFTHAGSVSVRLFRDGSGMLAVAVRDTGIGMDAAYLPKLFEPFSQEDSGYTRKFEGSGLGLALTRRYLDLNGAAIDVASTKGAGTTLTIRFPHVLEVAAEAWRPAEAAEAEAATPAAEAPAPAPANGAGRTGVLVVEDHPDTLSYMRTVLEAHYDVYEARDGEDARALLREHQEEIRLILMDLSLSGDEDGIELTRALRRDPRWASVPIVATTAHAFAEDRARALAAGCDSFLAKPVNHRALLALMIGFLDRGGAGRETSGAG